MAQKIRLNGQKVWTTWGFRADFAVLLARTVEALGIVKHFGDIDRLP